MRVRLKTGIFADVEGRVTEIRQNCRVVLALSGVDQCFSMETRMEDLEIIGETAAIPVVDAMGQASI